MKILITVVFAVGLALAIWAENDRPRPPGKRTMAEGLFFSSITLSNDIILAEMPLTQIRFLSFINGTNSGFVDSNHIFNLKSGDTLELVEKHYRITATPMITESNTELRVTTIFDARSFGDGIKTNQGTVKLK